MDIRFKCPQCGQSFVVDDSAVGCVYQCTCCSASVTVPSAVPPVIPPVRPVAAAVTVQRWAINSGWICFAAGAVAMLIPLMPTFFIYLPLFLASFVLGVIGLFQKRVAAGIALLAAHVIGIPVIFMISIALGLATLIGGSGGLTKQASLKFVVPPATAGYPVVPTNYNTTVTVADAAPPVATAAEGHPTNALLRIQVLRFAVNQDQRPTEIANPSVSDIRRAILAIGQNKDESYLILEQKEGTYLQVAGDQQGGYILEYQEADLKSDHPPHFRSPRSYTAAELVNVLISYATGTAEWKQSAEWELKKL